MTKKRSLFDELIQSVKEMSKIRKQEPSNEDYRNKSNTVHAPKNTYNRKKDKQRLRQGEKND